MHKAIYTDAHFVPKHHFLWDVASQWDRQEEVFDALVIERLHLRVKAVAENTHNTTRLKRLPCQASSIVRPEIWRQRILPIR